MKRAFCLVLILLLLPYSVSMAASYPFELTEAIINSVFSDPKWDVYHPVQYSMNAVDNGSGVVVMGNEDGHNILCVLQPSSEGWEIAVENDGVVPDAVFLDSDSRPDLMRMDDETGTRYSFTVSPYRNKEGGYGVTFSRGFSGEWRIHGFSFEPSFSGDAARLGYTQFGMYEGNDLPEGKLHIYAAKNIGAGAEPEVDRRIINKDETGLTFTLSEFVLEEYITALLSQYCDENAIKEMLAYPVTDEEMAADRRALYDKNGNVNILFEAFLWEHGYYLTWDLQDWIVFENTLSELIQEKADLRSDISKLSQSGYRMPNDDELSYDEALDTVAQIIANHQTESGNQDTNRLTPRAVLLGSPPDGLPPMWKVAYFSKNYKEGFVAQFDAKTGEETDFFEWDGSILATFVPFIYTEEGEMAKRLEEMRAFTIYYYYNPDGGKYYHEASECTSVSSRFLPMKRFLRIEITQTPYASLAPCPYCVHD